MSSFLGREDEEREKARDASLEVPYDLKAVAFMLDERYKQSVVISMVGKAGRAEQIIRSNTVRGEVAYNIDQAEMIENEGLKPADDWCTYCEEENYYWCEYRLYGQKQSCPEYELSKKRSKETLTSPLGTAQQVAAAGAGRVDVQVKTGEGWKPIPVKDEEKPKTTPIPVQPLTGVQSYKGHAPSSPVKTGFQAPTAPKSTLPFGLLYKCPRCWHWLESEEKLAIHFKWSCPEREGNTPETQTFLIPCKCCGGDFDKMVVSKKPPAAEGTNEKEADTK